MRSLRTDTVLSAMGMSSTCYGLATDLSFMLQICCRLVSDRAGKSDKLATCYGENGVMYFGSNLHSTVQQTFGSSPCCSNVAGNFLQL